MGNWEFRAAKYPGGIFQLIITKMVGGNPVNASNIRGAPTQLDSYTDADPFGDSTAQFTFPSITPFDDLKGSDLGPWLGYYSNVDLYWQPAVPFTAQYVGMQPPNLNPLNNQYDICCPVHILDSAGRVVGYNRFKVWEGFISSMDFTADDTSSGLQVTCQGALFQLDRYFQKPFYPPQPWPLEMIIQDAFDRKDRPPLRIRKLQIAWPAGWKLVVPKYTGTANAFTSVAKPGSKWSGYSSRETGSWERTLTGFVQDRLTVMITDKRSGVTTGNQWTINHLHESPTNAGRTPQLAIRDRNRTPDFSLWVGTPGVTIRLSGDSTQSSNVIYGDGTGLDGAMWRNAVISNDGVRTDYLPLAASADVYPKPTSATHNASYIAGTFLTEANTHFGTGFDQVDAVSYAKQALIRDKDPGWTGTITLSVDPSHELPRWLIRAGMTVLLKGFLNSGEKGLKLHISSKSANPMQGTVELTVDTRYRDLLTVEQAIAGTRDQLTPVKMLQINKATMLIHDLRAPWDYSAGSGFIPTASRLSAKAKPRTELFPNAAWMRSHPPRKYKSWYVQCNARAGGNNRGAWAGPIPILMSEGETIIRTEVVCVDINGHIVPAPFHFSLYFTNPPVSSMPHLLNDWSAFQDNAFESVDMRTGVPVSTTLAPANGFLIGWGNVASGTANRAGFSPGRESNGASATGLLVDESQWTFNMDAWREFFTHALVPGFKLKTTDLTLYAMFYCEYPTPVYFQGRMYRQNPSGAN